ncbi:MAG: Acetyl esterase Axe7A [Phycisphaerales bacterium]|nr:Acetyl esterase Axe7A [Phycisphaerales bacterium]
MTSVKTILALPLLCALAARGQSITVTADHADRVYRVGETATWSIKADGVVGDMAFAVLPGQGEPTAKGAIAASTDATTFKSTFDKPSTVLVKVTGKTAEGKEVIGLGGAVAGVDQIEPSAPRPDDFDDFWIKQMERSRAIPSNPRLTAGNAEKPAVQYAQITMDHCDGSHVQGQVARPVKGDQFPAILQTQWAGVYALDKHWVTDRAADGWLALNIEPHDLPIDRPAEFYKQQFDGPLKNYWAIGNDSRETSYFLRMYLSCIRAIDYLKTRPDWDGKTLVVFGGSQGGQQALVAAALCEGITAVMADVPAGCDMLGPSVGRRGGWPQWYDWTRGVDGHTPLDAEKVHQASRYFDVVNFASRIRCPALIATGLIDDVCPSTGVIAAYNQIHSPKRLVLMVDAGHQSVKESHAPFDHLLWQQWLPVLVKGQLPPTTP